METYTARIRQGKRKKLIEIQAESYPNARSVIADKYPTWCIMWVICGTLNEARLWLDTSTAGEV